MPRWFTLATLFQILSVEIVRADASFALLDGEARRASVGWLPVARLQLDELRLTLRLVAESATFFGRVRLFFRRLFGLAVEDRYRFATRRDRAPLEMTCVVDRNSTALAAVPRAAAAGGRR